MGASENIISATWTLTHMRFIYCYRPIKCLRGATYSKRHTHLATTKSSLGPPHNQSCLKCAGAAGHGLHAHNAPPRRSARASHCCLGAQKQTRQLSATRGPAPMLKCTQPTSQAGQAAPRARRAHAIDYRHAANWPLYPYKQRYALGSSPAGRCTRRTWQPSGTGTGVPGQRSRAHLLQGRCVTVRG